MLRSHGVSRPHLSRSRRSRADTRMGAGMHGLSAEDLDLQARARTLADELVPYEVEAELNRGELPPEVVAKHRARVVELGLDATNIPVEHGGRGCTSLQQVL